MTPSPVGDNVRNKRLANIKHSANYFLGVVALSSELSNLNYLLVSQFCIGMTHPLFIGKVASAMFYSVKCIRPFRVPSKIVQKIVNIFAVVVTGLQSWGARTPKGHEYQLVYGPVKMIPVACQGYTKVFISKILFENTLWLAINHIVYAVSTLINPAPIRPNPSLVRDIVKSFISLNWQPSFWSFVRGCGKILISHGVALLIRGASWLGPEWRSARYPAHSFLYHGIGQFARDISQN